MSKPETELPKRLRAAGATALERRLLEAAGSEAPSRELSERMAQAIGISMVAGGSAATESAKAGSGGVKAAGASKSVVPWVSGALVAVGVIVGAFVATHREATPSAALAAKGATLSSSASSVHPLAMPAPVAVTQPADAPPEANEEVSPKAAAVSARGRHGTAAGELAKQIALVDAARSALAGGEARRALAIVREYQSAYPTGTFRPEVSAVKIEALVNMGRTAEARTLAEQFVVAYGPGPLAARVARLAHIAEP